MISFQGKWVVANRNIAFIDHRNQTCVRESESNVTPAYESLKIITPGSSNPQALISSSPESITQVFRSLRRNGKDTGSDYPAKQTSVYMYLLPFGRTLQHSTQAVLLGTLQDFGLVVSQIYKQLFHNLFINPQNAQNFTPN